MKRFFLGVVFFAVLSASAQEYLISFENTVNPGDYCVLEKIGSRFVAVVNKNQLETLRRRQCDMMILDTDPRSKLYYLVFSDHDDEKALSRVSTILQKLYNPDQIPEYRQSYLVMVNEKQELSLLDLLVNLKRVTMDPMVFDPAVVPASGEQRANYPYNPLIQKMVNAVSEDTLRAFVRYLTDSVSSRSARYASNRDQAVAWICKKFRDYGLDSVYTQTVPGYQYAPNPIGVKLGKRYPSYSRYFLIGGHCDALPHMAINKGADDNATGIAATIEAARVMKNYSFEYTIVFMGFNAEEVGLVGSEEYAKRARARGDTIIAALTHDMIGRTSGASNYLRVRYPNDIAAGRPFSDLYSQAASSYTTLRYSIGGTAGTGGSDHASFIKYGYNAFFLIESAFSSNSVYHTIHDTLDCPNGLNDTRFFTQCTQASIACLAMGPVGTSTGASVIEEITDAIAQSKALVKERTLSIVQSGNTWYITFNAAVDGAHLNIRLYNASGRIVRALSLTEYREGLNTVRWDGRDNRGNAAPKGAYYIECTAAGKRFVEKVVLVY